MLKKRLFALAAALLLFAACQAPKENIHLPGSEPSAPVESTGGPVAAQGKWVYYINGDNLTRSTGERFLPEWGALCRMEETGANRAVLVEKEVSSFFIEKDTVYFAEETGGRAYAASVKTDGSSYRRLAGMDSLFSVEGGTSGGIFYYAGGALFFTDNGLLWRYAIEGGKKEQVSQNAAYNLRASGEYIYYSEAPGGAPGPLFRAAKSGGPGAQITQAPAYALHFSADVLYYVNLTDTYCYAFSETTLSHSSVAHGGYADYAFLPETGQIAGSFSSAEEEGGIYLMPLLGGARVQISQNRAEMLRYHDGWLYYVNNDSMYELWRVRLDGSSEEQLTEDGVSTAFPVAVLRGRLYYISENDDGRIYSLGLANLDLRCDQYENYN